MAIHLVSTHSAVTASFWKNKTLIPLQLKIYANLTKVECLKVLFCFILQSYLWYINASLEARTFEIFYLFLTICLFYGFFAKALSEFLFSFDIFLLILEIKHLISKFSNIKIIILEFSLLKSCVGPLFCFFEREN